MFVLNLIEIFIRNCRNCGSESDVIFVRNKRIFFLKFVEIFVRYLPKFLCEIAVRICRNLCSKFGEIFCLNFCSKFFEVFGLKFVQNWKKFLFEICRNFLSIFLFKMFIREIFVGNLTTILQRNFIGNKCATF